MVIATFVEDLAAWATLGTAVGTVLLAFATFLLAQRTSREVEAATAQAEASGRQVAQSARQAEAAERALLAQTRPLLSDVPWGLTQRVTGYRYNSGDFLGTGEAMYGDASALSVSVTTGDSGRAHLKVPFRNVGNGTAIVRSVEFIFSAGPGLTGGTSSPVVPPGELADATLDADAQSPGFAEVVAMREGSRTFSVLVSYADADGTPRGAIRFDAHAQGDRGWFVRQVFWADDARAAREGPAFGSQPSW